MLLDNVTFRDKLRCMIRKNDIVIYSDMCTYYNDSYCGISHIDISCDIITRPNGRKRGKMTPLELMNTTLKEKLSIIPRVMNLSEIQKMENGFLFSDAPIKKMITFPLPVPKWSKGSMVTDCTVQAWAWEREGNVVLLTKLPQGMQGKILAGKVSFLNNQADIAGRFFHAEDDYVYYLFSQAIYVKDGTGNDSRLVDFHAFKAASEAANHLILYSLGNAVADLSRTLHLVGAVCIRVDRAGWQVELDAEIEF